MKTSAGILLYRGDRVPRLEVLLGHPGGPYWQRRDAGAWTIPKGEFDPDTEAALVAARREFAEETGQPTPSGEALDLGQVKQRGGKVVHCFALAGDFDPQALISNTFELVWPPRSGRIISVPELDRVAWLDSAAARRAINPAQAVFIDRLTEQLER